MQLPVPGEVRRVSPLGQAAEPRNECVLQSFNLAKYKLSLDKNPQVPTCNLHNNNITISQYCNIIRSILLYPCADSSD